jgi:hypothetical protein
MISYSCILILCFLDISRIYIYILFFRIITSHPASFFLDNYPLWRPEGAVSSSSQDCKDYQKTLNDVVDQCGPHNGVNNDSDNKMGQGHKLDYNLTNCNIQNESGKLHEYQNGIINHGDPRNNNLNCAIRQNYHAHTGDCVNGNLNQNAYPKDSLNQDANPEDGLYQNAHLKDNLDQNTYPKDSTKQDSQPKDGLHENAHSKDSLNHAAHTKDSLYQGTHPNDSLNQDTHPKNGLNEGAHPKAGRNQHAHPKDRPNQDVHSNDGLNQGAHPKDGLDLGAHPKDVLNQDAHSLDGLNQGVHPKDVLSQGIHPKDHVKDQSPRYENLRIFFNLMKHFDSLDLGRAAVEIQ